MYLINVASFREPRALSDTFTLSIDNVKNPPVSKKQQTKILHQPFLKRIDFDHFVLVLSSSVGSPGNMAFFIVDNKV